MIFLSEKRIVLFYGVIIVFASNVNFFVDDFFLPKFLDVFAHVS